MRIKFVHELKNILTDRHSDIQIRNRNYMRAKKNQYDCYRIGEAMNLYNHPDFVTFICRK